MVATAGMRLSYQNNCVIFSIWVKLLEYRYATVIPTRRMVMHAFKRFCFYGFVFGFCSALSVWTYPRHQFRGVASVAPVEANYHVPYHYDASYKL